MCWIVLILILSKFSTHFKVETNEVYDVAGEVPLGDRYYFLNAAGDYCAATYIMVFIVKAAYFIPFWGDFIHHGTALVTIWLLRNAVEFEYAPSFLCFFAACMLLHSAASGPMYTCFLLLKLNPNRSKSGMFARLFMTSSVVKQCIMLTAHIANFWNYRLFFNDETFKLRDVSTSDWNDKPYFETRLTYRDLFLNIPWMRILVICLPILWIILAGAQFYNTLLQFKIARYELRKVSGIDIKEFQEDGKRDTSLEESISVEEEK